MEQRRRDMHQDQGKKRESQVEMRVPEPSMQTVALRQDRRQVQAAEQHDAGDDQHHRGSDRHRRRRRTDRA